MGREVRNVNLFETHPRWHDQRFQSESNRKLRYLINVIGVQLYEVVRNATYTRSLRVCR